MRVHLVRTSGERLCNALRQRAWTVADLAKEIFPAIEDQDEAETLVRMTIDRERMAGEHIVRVARNTFQIKADSVPDISKAMREFKEKHDDRG